MIELPSKPLWRVDEAAAHFDVTRQTIYLWIDHGLLEAEKYNGCIRISRESIKNFRLSAKIKPLE
jgi:excisionase family DNA binding protein